MLNRMSPGNVVGRASVILLVLLAMASRAAAQQSEPTFEVASIKENKSGDNRTYMNVVGGRLVATKERRAQEVRKLLHAKGWVDVREQT